METCTIEATCNVLEPPSTTNEENNYNNVSSNVVNNSSSSDSPIEASPEPKTVIQVTSENSVCNEGSEHVNENQINCANEEENSSAKVDLHQAESNLISAKEDIETVITASPVVGNYVTLRDRKTTDSNQTIDSVEIIENNLLNVANETPLPVETLVEKVDVANEVQKDSSTVECKDMILVPVSVSIAACQNTEPKAVSVREISEWDNSNNLSHSKSLNDSVTETVDTEIEKGQSKTSESTETISVVPDGQHSTVGENATKIGANCEDAITAETLIAISILQNNLGNVNNKSAEQVSSPCNNSQTDGSSGNGSVTKENEMMLRKPLTPISVEIGVQANDYEIERRSGKVPARRRVIPYKFR